MAAQLDPLPVVNIRKIHLYQCDHRGTPAALINQEGQTEWKAEVDPWGEILSEENPNNIEQPLWLPDQWYDEESGLHYNRHRYYNPAQGRYITQDPIGLRGGENLYIYVLNPLQYIDPLGLSGFDALGSWFNQPGMKDAYNKSATQSGYSVLGPESEWIFTGWQVNDGPEWAFWSKSKSVNAMCEDQSGNKKSSVTYIFRTDHLILTKIVLEVSVLMGWTQKRLR
ncbi:RHS repeat-associated core domain-containing protein [Citrobacter sp. R56]|uniref:RHS repeat-associated core domain-containing protein n=1 Tax=Citrobacter sp. R56 TaxID=1573676 RepID=UPI00193B9EEE|nr:RHS repeat-associated core domain-containing protein [Citrobacter sp. R56]QRG80750.1 RHS domain-containing protein [Citrobacter sp. R56]